MNRANDVSHDIVTCLCGCLRLRVLRDDAIGVVSDCAFALGEKMRSVDIMT